MNDEYISEKPRTIICLRNQTKQKLEDAALYLQDEMGIGMSDESPIEWFRELVFEVLEIVGSAEDLADRPEN